MVNEKFCAFIISYNRCDSLTTLKALLNANYSGDYYIVIGKDEKNIKGYIKNFGKKKIVIFDKLKYVNKIDFGDTNTNNLIAGVFVRNALFDIAKEKGYDYFAVFDDDITDFNYAYRIILPDETIGIRRPNIKNIDEIFNIYLNFLKNTNVPAIGFCQQGDYIGGVNSRMMKATCSRRILNSMIFNLKESLNNNFVFNSRREDDIIFYNTYGNRGILFFTFSRVGCRMSQQQKKSGGMTEFYNESNIARYLNMMYCIIRFPSFMKLRRNNPTVPVLHYKTFINNAYPKIIPEIKENINE